MSIVSSNPEHVPAVEPGTFLRKSRGSDELEKARYQTRHLHPETECQSPICSQMVPPGMFTARKVTYFCSNKCYRYVRDQKTSCGTCEHCFGPIPGSGGKGRNPRFCSREHATLFSQEEVLGQTGSFRSLIEEYMAVVTTYSPGSLSSVKPSLAHFFTHVFVTEKLLHLDDITPASVSRFMAAERLRGMTSSNAVGHIATLFNWLIDHGRFLKRNPVISRIHSQKSKPATARPYEDHDVKTIRDLIHKRGGLVLELAFAIGEECGLRVGEVANIRLEDVDERAQKIFVRLPTKNKETRRVPYHDSVAELLSAWRNVRNSSCGHDHLLHGSRGASLDTGSLDGKFKDFLGDEVSPANSFCFHRLRHTWATRLMNNGMELAVLKELGGWKNWNSMQKYIKVLDRTVREQYEAAYRKMTDRAESRKEQTLSLTEFASLEAPKGPPTVRMAA